ncbi:MAG: PorT family protein [Mediterranea massiliensis]|nr:PorT family protein [Mediterranea massiliensis]
MKLKLFGLVILLLYCPLLLWAQRIVTLPKKEEKKERIDERPINFGFKAGFTSSLFLVSDLYVNGMKIDHVENKYKVGFSGSLFMRINMKRHFIQPEISYNINRCNILFDKPMPEGSSPGSSKQLLSINNSIHSIDIPVTYGYNIIKDGPYSMAVFAGPKLRYIWEKHSDIQFHNFDQQEIVEEFYPLTASLTIGVAVTVSRIFFDFRYDIGLLNISKGITFQPAENSNIQPDTKVEDQLRFHHRENVLSFSLGVFF